MKRLMILLVALVLTVVAQPAQAQAPDSPIMINHYGNLAMEKGDFDQAIDDFKRACSAGLSAGCSNVYEALFNKGLVAMQGGDNATALQSFQQSCQGNVADACHNLGVYYQAGVGGAVNINQARILYTKACGLGQKKSCENLASLDGQGPTAPQQLNGSPTAADASAQAPPVPAPAPAPQNSGGPQLIIAENAGTPCLAAAIENAHINRIGGGAVNAAGDSENDTWNYDIVLKNNCAYTVVWYTEIFTGPAPPPQSYSSGQGPFIYGGYGWPNWGQKALPPNPDYLPHEAFSDVPLGPGGSKLASGNQRLADLKPVQLWITSCNAYAADDKRANTLFTTGAPLSADQRFFCAPNMVPAVRY